jgi:hypothetical protein
LANASPNGPYTYAYGQVRLAPARTTLLMSGGPRQEETAMKRHASDSSRVAALWASLSIMLLSLAFAAAM